MRAGKLRHKITIRKSIDVNNSLGESEETPVIFDSVRAQIIPINGNEYFAASQTKSKVTHKIIIRYLKGITSDMHIDFKGRLFEIVSPPINFQEKNKWLEIMASENV